MSLMKEPETLKALLKAISSAGDDKLVVVEFMHEFCYACEKVRPHYGKLMPGYVKEADFCRVEVQDMPGAVDRYKVESIPTFVAFHRKREVARYCGYDQLELALFVADAIKAKRRALRQEKRDPVDPRKAVLGSRRRSERARGMRRPAITRGTV